MFATHNSSTGEKPYNFWAKYFPFIAKCQDKTLLMQYVYGARLFDIRVRYDKNNELRCCHGLAQYDMTLRAIVNNFIYAPSVPTINVTYEGKLAKEKKGRFVMDVLYTVEGHHSIKLGYIAIKKPKWTILHTTSNQLPCVINYTKIVGWKILLPFPRLWQWLRRKEIRRNKLNYSGELLMEDFV